MPRPRRFKPAWSYRAVDPVLAEEWARRRIEQAGDMGKLHGKRSSPRVGYMAPSPETLLRAALHKRPSKKITLARVWQ